MVLFTLNVVKMIDKINEYFLLIDKFNIFKDAYFAVTVGTYVNSKSLKAVVVAILL